MRKMMAWAIALGLFTTGVLHAQNTASDIAGNWQGTLKVGTGLRTVLKIVKAGPGWKGQLYSIDQGPGAMALDSLTVQGVEVRFTIKAIGLTYKGTLDAATRTISGSVTQEKETNPLVLEHVSAENTWAIPEPARPMAKDAKPGFEVATIKPAKPNSQGKNIDFEGRHFKAQNFNVNDLIALAYGLHSRQILGAPGWFDSELYDIDGVPDVEGEPSDAQTDMMMQKLLAERFQLKFHHEQRELSVFVITVANGGPKMTVSADATGDGSDFSFRRLGDLTVGDMTIADFAKWMQASVMDRPVMDKTGLTDHYDFRLRWTPDETQFAQFRSTGAVPKKNEKANAPPALNDALQQQIGLKIEPIKAMDDVIVIDHVEHPSPN